MDFRSPIVRKMIGDFELSAIKGVQITVLNSTENLYAIADNYNWDDGFGIPQEILDNDQCDLSTALLIFYRADGFSYLEDKTFDAKLPEWSDFIKRLYDAILAGKYPKGKNEFKVPLTKVQIYKLSKTMTEEEKIFIRDITNEEHNEK